MNFLKLLIWTTLLCSSIVFGSSTTSYQADSIHNSAGGAIISVPSVGTNFCTDTNTLTLQNKTISGASNTLTNPSLKRTINTQTGSTYTVALVDGYGSGNLPLVNMSSSSGQTVTIPPHSSVAFAVGEQIDVSQAGTGSVNVAPGSGVTLNSANGYQQLGPQYSFANLIQTATDVWLLTGATLTHPAFISASCTSCAITTDGNFKVLTFNTSDSFVISSGSGTVASLVVAGGGGGGAGYAGGGGAGGLIYTTPGATYGSGSYSVTVGTGGTGGSQGGSLLAQNGTNSVFDPSGANIIAVGGGHGGDGYGVSNGAGGNGGSGGGGSGFAVSGGFSGGTGTSLQGNAGGAGNLTPYGGGGGGCGAVGHDGAGNDGVGGAGCSNSITGSAVFYAGGGGAAVNTSGQSAAGGTGGGGNGIKAGSGAVGQSGTNGLGGGAGGGSDSTTGGVGGVGGSGTVILRYQFQ